MLSKYRASGLSRFKAPFPVSDYVSIIFSIFMKISRMIIEKLLTGDISANKSSGMVDNARSQCTPSVGITTSANATSKHAPSAQKHWKIFHLSLFSYFYIYFSLAVIIFISFLFRSGWIFTGQWANADCHMIWWVVWCFPECSFFFKNQSIW